MKVSELRLGNLVSLSYMTEKAFSVTAIENNNCCLKSTEQGFKTASIYPYVQPIPLTDEWLEKLGGLKDEYGDVFIEVDSDSDMRLYLSTKHYIQLVQSYHCPMFDYEHIRYVHQLQNLFSALTGKELTIKEDEL